MNEHNKSDTEELAFMRRYIMGKMDALQRDVLHCLQHPFAPMPAILWCASCVNLLGALLKGHASSGHTKNTEDYMEKFMGYTQDQRELILNVFRHKLIHLAQPGPFIKHKDKIVVWNYVHEYTPDHLTLRDVPNPNPDSAIELPPWTRQPHINQAFTLGITQFTQDIICSVAKPGGYLHELETNSEIFKNCRDAIKEIFTPLGQKKRDVSNYCEICNISIKGSKRGHNIKKTSRQGSKRVFSG